MAQNMKTGEVIMTNRGFTIIELLIVIAIIGILVGVAVPYYNDYIYDARLSTLKQNLATYRQVLNQFRGDNSRGPFKVPVYKDAGATLMLDDHNSGSSTGSELVSGPIQNISGTFTRRSNLQYLQAMPVFLNPKDGSPVPNTDWTLSNPTAYFYDDTPADGKFNIDTEFAFVNNDANTVYDDGIDQQILNNVAWPGGATTALDYTSFTITIDGVTY
jgi:prepilin-type N-terminal cleavage/methylation domain-containing protein